MVGRDVELAQLHHWLAKALAGKRQLVFVPGEAGIGKTALVDAFLRSLVSNTQNPESEEESQNSKAFPELSRRIKGQKSKLAAPRFPTPDPWLVQGQCIEHFGAGEAYLPVLAALGQLGQHAQNQYLVEVLSQFAPTWLAQLPALVTPADFERLQRQTVGTTQTRMLREMAEALEVLTHTQPLVLVLEDLHWSDPSTLDLLSVIARRRQSARLLILGTYRPVEVLTNGHPLRIVSQELQLHRQCEELPLGLLTVAHVTEYLEKRLDLEKYDRVSQRQLADTIYRRTEGNPLFMVNMVESWLQGGAVDSHQLEKLTPTTIRQMIDRQFDHLTKTEQQVLTGASVIGAEFSAVVVAAGRNADVNESEFHCAELARRELFLQASGNETWPDGTVTECYRFRHALYQEVVYERVTAGHRSTLHQRIGKCLEAAYGARASEVAAVLAMHYERGQDYPRAIRYREQAGKNAMRRNAHIEAISHLTSALELLKTLPATIERARQELTLQVALGTPLIATKGHSALEVAQAHSRARELSQQVGETPQLFPALYGLFAVSLVRGEYQMAQALGNQIFNLARSLQDPDLLVEAHNLRAHPLFFLGEFVSARAHFEQNISLYNPQKHSPQVSGLVQDSKISSLSFISWILWLCGYPDQALKKNQEVLNLAQELSHPFSLAYALTGAARFHHFRHDIYAAQAQSEALIELSLEQGFSLRAAQGTIVRGWALAKQGRREEGIAQIRQGLAACRAAGAEHFSPSYLAMLSEAYETVEPLVERQHLLTEALSIVEKTGERYYEAELYRLKGELLLTQESKEQGAQSKEQKSKGSAPHSQILDPQGEAEECFWKAIEVARKQQAKSWELRATMSFVRLRHGQTAQHATRTAQHIARTKLDDAHRMLSEVYNWFTEGYGTKDLQEAKALLEDLGKKAKGESGEVDQE